MREELKQLIKLQGLDETLRKLQETRQQLTKQITEAQRSAEAEKKSLEDRTAETKSFRKAMDKREGDLKELEGKMTKLEVQLNTASTNKEYATFQHEILGLKADKSRAEDDILKMYDQIESQQSELKQMGQRTTEAEKAAQERRKSIEAGIADAEARIEALKKERAAFTQTLSPAFLGPYERLRKKGDGRAMAACRNYVCMGCRMSLTANTISLLMMGDKLITCQSCGRILFIAEGEDLTGIATAGRKDS